PKSLALQPGNKKRGLHYWFISVIQVWRAASTAATSGNEGYKRAEHIKFHLGRGIARSYGKDTVCIYTIYRQR
ncbi:hypothetical protein, partial [Yersinia pestis]